MIGGEATAVYADWHRLELRKEKERIDCGPPIAAMYGAFHFVADRYLVCFIGGGVVESELRTFDVVARSWLSDPLELATDMHAVGVHPIDPRLAITYDDGIHFWDVARQRVETVLDETLVPGFCNVVAFHPREPILAVGGYQQLSLITSGGDLERVVSEAHYGDVDEAVWIMDNLLATSGITEIKLWDRADLALRHTLDLEGARCNGLVASADGQMLCVLCNDHSARIVALASMNVRRESDVGAAVFDGSSLVVAGASGIRRI